MPKNIYSDPEDARAYRRAQEQIQSAARTGQKKLHLGGMKLNALPPEIGELTGLTDLYLMGNNLEALPPEIGKLTALTELDVRGNQLRVLPVEIGNLTALTGLDLSGNQLSILPAEIGSLTALTAFMISNNQLIVLPPTIGQLAALNNLDISGNRLSALPPEIAGLKALTRLYITRNQLSVLPPEIGQLTELRELFCWGNLLNTLPAEIGKLTSLTDLAVMTNRLSALPPEIGCLTALTKLWLSGNELKALPPEIEGLTELADLSLTRNRLSFLPRQIGRLSALTTLDLAENELAVLPPEVRRLTALTELYLQDNPALGLPPEVLGAKREHVVQGVASAADPHAILDYYFSRQPGLDKPLDEVKLVLVGRGGAGKTSLVERLVWERFNPSQKETLGVKRSDWLMHDFHGREVLAHIWDFAGQTITHSMHQFFLSVRTVYVLVLTGRENSEREDAEYWLRLIAAYGTDASGSGPPVIVALNKWDDRGSSRARVDRRALRERYPFVIEFVETDCATRTGIARLRELLHSTVDTLEWVRAPFPEAYRKVKSKLEAVDDPHLPYEAYREICRLCGVVEEGRQDLLAENLHALGVALNFRKDERLRFASVLKPDWLTDHVYMLVRHAEEKSGVLHRAALPVVLTDENDAEMRRFLVEMMVRFELAYPLEEDDAEPAKWLVPQALPDSQPEGVESFRDAPEATRIRYTYRALPVSIVPRFIVRTHPLIDGDLRWASGVVLALHGARLLVRADYVEKQVEIAAIGPAEARRELAGLAQQEFRFINGQIRGLNPLEEIEAAGKWLPLKTLEQDEAAHQLTGVATEVGTVLVKPDEKLNELSVPAARDKSWKPRVFVCYSQKDDSSRKTLQLHLKILRTQGLLEEAWADQSLDPGEDWDRRIKAELERADVIIMLVSAAALATDYIRNVEMPRALERHAARQTIAIAVILEECLWQKTPIGQWQAIQPNRKPVRDNTPQRNGWATVARELAKLFERLREEHGHK